MLEADITLPDNLVFYTFKFFHLLMESTDTLMIFDLNNPTVLFQLDFFGVNL